VLAYQGRQRILLIIGVIFVVTGLPIGLAFSSPALIDVALDLTGERCEAEVLAAELQSNVRINHRHPTEIRFRCTAGGVGYESTSSTLDDELVARATPGARVEAEVLPSLSVGRVKGTTYATMGYLGLLFFLHPIVGSVLVFVAVRSNRRESRAFVHGKAVRGRVVRREEDRNTRMNRRRPWIVGWEFEVDGQRYEGSLSNMDKAELERGIPTSEVVVLYDPERPRVNTAYVE
jgi:hypothetical protein